MTAWIRRHPLVAFLSLAYLGSWIGWSPWWLSASGLAALPYQLPLPAIAAINQLGLFAGPFAAALLVTHLTAGPAGRRALLRRLVHWRAHPGWYALALLAIPVATALGYLLTTPTAPTAAAALLPITYATYLIGGPIQEEPGWRGVALPHLQRRLHPLPAALLLGVVHCFWHAPLFLIREWDTARSDPGQLLAYLVLTVSLSVVLSWLTNGSGGSLLLAILGHNSVNWALFAVATLTGHPVATTWPAALGLTLLAVVAARFLPGTASATSTDSRSETKQA